MASRLSDPRTKAVYDYIVAHPGSTQREIRDGLGGYSVKEMQAIILRLRQTHIIMCGHDGRRTIRWEAL